MTRYTLDIELTDAQDEKLQRLSSFFNMAAQDFLMNAFRCGFDIAECTEAGLFPAAPIDKNACFEPPFKYSPGHRS